MLRKNNNVRLLAALSALALCLSSTALAASPVEQKNTNAEVTFQANAGNTLYFFEAPDLNFGTRTISLDDRYYGHHNASGNTQLIVDDIRGNQQGWRVEVTLAPFTATTGTPETLNGATITFATPGFGSNYVPTPTPNPYLGNSSAASSVEVPATGTSVRFLTAVANTGMARSTFTWQTNAASAALENTATNLSNTKIELKVVGGSALARTYSATLNWGLYDTP